MALDPEQITAKNFKEFYNRILPYLNGAGGNDYSTEEKVIGSWIDGKPLYQKTCQYTIVGGYNGRSTVFSIDTGIAIPTNIEHVVDYNILVYNPDKPLEMTENIWPMSNGANSANVIRFDDSSNNFVFVSNDRWSTDVIIVWTIRYTKTTD